MFLKYSNPLTLKGACSAPLAEEMRLLRCSAPSARHRSQNVYGAFASSSRERRAPHESLNRRHTLRKTECFFIPKFSNPLTLKGACSAPLAEEMRLLRYSVTLFLTGGGSAPSARHRSQNVYGAFASSSRERRAPHESLNRHHTLRKTECFLS